MLHSESCSELSLKTLQKATSLNNAEFASLKTEETKLQKSLRASPSTAESTGKPTVDVRVQARGLASHRDFVQHGI